MIRPLTQSHMHVKHGLRPKLTNKAWKNLKERYYADIYVRKQDIGEYE